MAGKGVVEDNCRTSAYNPCYRSSPLVFNAIRWKRRLACCRLPFLYLCFFRAWSSLQRLHIRPSVGGRRWPSSFSSFPSTAAAANKSPKQRSHQTQLQLPEKQDTWTSASRLAAGNNDVIIFSAPDPASSPSTVYAAAYRSPVFLTLPLHKGLVPCPAQTLACFLLAACLGGWTSAMASIDSRWAMVVASTDSTSRKKGAHQLCGYVRACRPAKTRFLLTGSFSRFAFGWRALYGHRGHEEVWRSE